MKTLVKGFATALMVVALMAPAGAWAQSKVQFGMDYIIYGKHAGFYAALDRGFYKAVGLDTTINRGYGSGDTVKKVALGTAHFGFADSGAVIVGRTKGTMVRLVGMIHDKSMFSIVSLKDTGIRTPKDLEGKVLGGPAGSATWLIFPAFANINGVNAKKVKYIPMPSSAKTGSILAGKIDGGMYYITEFPTAEALAAKQGKKLSALLYADWGVDVYSNGLIAPDTTIKGKPERVRKFTTATMKGIAWAVENPGEAVDILLRHYPAIKRDRALAHWKIAVDHLLTPTAKKHGIGYMSRDKMGKTVKIISTYMKLQPAPALDDVYTNEFLPKLYPKRR